MFGNHFYHEKTRKAVIVFGRLFNDIIVVRQNESNNESVSQIKVPLSYAPKVKYLERIKESPSLKDDTKVAIKLPRMSFEITSLSYNSERQIVKSNVIKKAGTDDTNRNVIYSSVPYDLGFQLNIYAKTQNDALQILEQILPTFNPQYSVSVKTFKDHEDITEDFIFSLQGVSTDIDYEGDLNSARTIIYTLEFLLPINYFGYINRKDIIRLSQVDLYDNKDNFDNMEDSDNSIERLIIKPDPESLNIIGDSDFDFTRE